MASLMENLISVLDKEYDVYLELLELSKKKTAIIVEGSLEALTQITEAEQNKSSEIANLEKSREDVMKDICIVLNIQGDGLRLTQLKDMLSSRPEEQAALADSIDKLKAMAVQMKRVNEQNQMLLENALDMVNFDLSLIQAMRQAPETANYNKGAYSSGSIMGSANGMFDAKQ